MNRKPLLLIALVALLALAVTAAVAAGSPNRKIWCVANLCVADDGGISPDKLPRHEKAPTTARLNGEISTKDGSHPPPFESMDLKIEKNIALDAVGLPTCRLGQLKATSSAAAKRACREAIVGSGEAEVEVAFPEQAPFRSTGPLILFNGGTKGPTTTLLLHAYVDVPAPTAIVVPAKITRIHDGPFGLRIQATIPRIAGGSGSVTMFDLEVGRKYAYKGRKKSLLSASCPDGSWMAKGEAKFVDGTTLHIAHLFPCTPEG
ncbi:MAG TPA: hypothetical protein VFN92_08040 [Solirubrobacterales bacterium]|nr:hypothetical protein [Solirubrobacterales bacterium]